MHAAIVAQRSWKDLNTFRFRDIRRTAAFSRWANAREPIVLQLEDPVLMIKWLRQAGQGHRGKLWEGHSGFILPELCSDTRQQRTPHAPPPRMRPSRPFDPDNHGKPTDEL